MEHTLTTKEELANDHAQRGAALLDAKGPAGWPDRVALSDLNMMNVHRCVLGQVYRDEPAAGPGWDPFSTAVQRLDVEYAIREHGFVGYAGQKDAWVRIITARRDERVKYLLSQGWFLTRDALSVVSPYDGWAVDINKITKAERLGRAIIAKLSV